MTARTPVLPGENPVLFQQRMEIYRDDFQPQNAAEEDLVERMAQESWRIDRALCAEAERACAQAKQAAVRAEIAAADKARRENVEATAIGLKLFADRRGREQAEHPILLVMQLESTAGGCRWLIDRWSELQSRLESGGHWQWTEKLMAVRLKGQQPLDAVDVPWMMQMFLACDMIDPQKPRAFHDLELQMTEYAWRAYERRLVARNVESMWPKGAAKAREFFDRTGRGGDWTTQSALAQASRTRRDAQRARCRALDARRQPGGRADP
jgi:hypothetical protein